MADRFILSRIEKLPLFDQLSTEQLDLVADAFQAIRYETGMTVFRQGQSSQGMMLIVSGRGVFTRINAQGFEEQIGQIGGGEYINESSLFADGAESATLRVTETMVILLLSRGRFANLLGAQPTIRANLRVPPSLGGQPPARSIAPPPQIVMPNAPQNPAQTPAPFVTRPPAAPPVSQPAAPMPSALSSAPAPAETPLRSAPERLFKGQRDDESVLHLFRRHWWSFARQMWIGVLLLLICIAVAIGTARTSGLLALSLIGVGLIAAGIVITYLYTEWKEDFLLVTDQRVVRVSNHRIALENTISEVPLDRVLEVNVERPAGDIAARLFNYGSVLVKTAGQSSVIEFEMIAQPNEVQAAIFSQRERYRESQAARERQQVQRDVQRALGIGAPPPAASPGGDLSGLNLRHQRGFAFARTRFVNRDGNLVYRKHFTVWFGHIFVPAILVLIGVGMMGVSVLSASGVLSGGVGLVAGMFIALIAGTWLYLTDWDWRNDLFILGDETLTVIRKRPFFLQNEVETIRLGQIENVVSDVRGFMNSLLDRGVVKIFLLGADPNQVKLLGPLFEPQELQAEVSRRQQAIKEQSARTEDEKNRKAVADYLAAYHQTVTGGAPAPGYTPNPPQPTAAPRPQAPPPPRDNIRPPNIPRTRTDTNRE